MADPSDRGQYCFRVNVQIYHRSSNIHPSEGQHRRFAQFYIVDSAIDNQARLNNEANIDCLPEFINNIERLFREIIVFARLYKIGTSTKCNKKSIA